MIGRFAILRPYFYRQRKRLLGIVATSILLAGVSVLYPWPLKLLIDYALADGNSALGLAPSTLVLLAAAGILALYVIGAAFDVVLSWSWMACGQRMVYDLMVDVFDHLLHVPVPLQRRKVGDYLERLFNDTWCIYTVANDALISPLRQMLTLIGITLVAAQVDTTLTFVSLVAAPAIAMSVFWFGPRLKQSAKKGREAHSELASFVHQTLTSLPLVQAFWTQDRNQQRFHDLANDVVATSQTRVLTNKTFSLVNGIFAESGRALVLLIGGAAALRGDLTAGTLILFMSYVKTMQQACEKLLKTYSTLRTIEASMDRLTAIQSMPILERAAVVPSAVFAKGDSHGSTIEFKHVSFEYEPGIAALSDVSFKIAAGERIGIVGESGAGKSTLVSLLASLIDPSSGTIEIHGINLQQVAVRDARAQIALLLQEAYLLPLTVAENIGIGKPRATRKQIETAAELAGATGFISRLPQGYDTVLGERGVTLSMGQQQRLALARAFVRDAPIVILDEPAAALDVASEKALISSFVRLTKGKTSVVISHRLSTLKGVDRIIVLDAGKIAEHGTPQELIAKRGCYYRFFATQDAMLEPKVCA